MKSSIFPRFCSLHRTYPNIFTIFGPAYNFLHKFKHKALLNQKGKKENNLKPGEAQPNGPQAGPHGRCAGALPPHTVTDGRVPLVRPSFFLSLRDAHGEVPPVSFFFNTHGGSATAPAAVGEGLSPCACAHQPRLREPIANTQTCSTLSLPPRPREWRAAAIADRGPATRAR